MSFSVNGGVFVVVVVLLTSVMNMNSKISSVRASLLVTEQQTSSSNNIADKEIASISFNGNIVNDNKPIEETTINTTTINTTTTTSETEHVLKRGKRYLEFMKNTKLSFNFGGKSIFVPGSTLWAHGYGFKASYGLENLNKNKLHRRDTYQTLGDLLDKSGFDGKACILKTFCAAHMNDNEDVKKGMLFKLLKYVFTLNDDDRRHFPYLKYDNCQQILHSHCPLSFNNISPFTDDV